MVAVGIGRVRPRRHGGITHRPAPLRRTERRSEHARHAPHRVSHVGGQSHCPAHHCHRVARRTPRRTSPRFGAPSGRAVPHPHHVARPGNVARPGTVDEARSPRGYAWDGGGRSLARRPSEASRKPRRVWHWQTRHRPWTTARRPTSVRWKLSTHCRKVRRGQARRVAAPFSPSSGRESTSPARSQARARRCAHGESVGRSPSPR